jgi:hypothetical protein
MNIGHALGLLTIGSIASMGLFYLLFKFEQQSEKERKENKEQN